MHCSAVFVLMLLAAAASARITSKTAVSTTTPDPDDEIDQGDPFQYSYAVEAEPNANSTRVEQSKAESSDGQEVVGQYKVLLPDGRLQTVTYTSGPNGYKATVKYVQVRKDMSSETSGRSFTPVRTTLPSTTTTTIPPPIVASSDEDTDEIVHAQPQRQTESIDGRTSSSSRSRQRGNRTRGERFRSSPLEQPTGDVTTATTAANIVVASVENVRTLKTPNADSIVAVRSRPTPPVLKTTWRFDGRRQRPEQVFSPDDDN